MQYPVDLQVHNCERKRHLNLSAIDHLYNKRDEKKDNQKKNSVSKHFMDKLCYMCNKSEQRNEML